MVQDCVLDPKYQQFLTAKKRMKEMKQDRKISLRLKEFGIQVLRLNDVAGGQGLKSRSVPLRLAGRRNNLYLHKKLIYDKR